MHLYVIRKIYFTMSEKLYFFVSQQNKKNRHFGTCKRAKCSSPVRHIHYLACLLGAKLRKRASSTLYMFLISLGFPEVAHVML